MSRVRQKAGEVMVEVYTDGSPMWPTLTLTQINGEVQESRLSLSDLHDLRYCIDRVLRQLKDGSS